MLCYIPMIFGDTLYVYFAVSVFDGGTAALNGFARFMVEPLMDVFCVALFSIFALKRINRLASTAPPPRVGVASMALHIIPIYVCGLIIYCLNWLGFILLIAPGFYLMSLTWVATPVAIFEMRGPIDAIKRSAKLVHGRKWSVFGVVLVFLVTMALVERLLSALYGFVGGQLLMRAGSDAWMIQTLFRLFYQALFGALTGLAAAYSYLHLKRVSEGVSEEDLTDVFR